MNSLELLLQKTKTDEEAIASLLENNKDDSWKLKSGDNLLRLLPSIDGIVIKEVKLHWGLGKVFICPKSYGESCPSCDFGWSKYHEYKELINNSSSEEEKEELKKQMKFAQKTFLPSGRYWAHVIDREEEQLFFEKQGYPEARIWTFNKTTAESLKDYYMNEDYNNLEDVMEGYDLRVVYDKEAAENRKQSIRVTARPKSSKILDYTQDFYKGKVSNDIEMAEVVLKMLDNAPKFEDEYPRLTPSQVDERLIELSKRADSDSEVEYTPPSSDGVVDSELKEIQKKLKSLTGEDAEIL